MRLCFTILILAPLIVYSTLILYNPLIDLTQTEQRILMPRSGKRWFGAHVEPGCWQRDVTSYSRTLELLFKYFFVFLLILIHTLYTRMSACILTINTVSFLPFDASVLSLRD